MKNNLFLILGVMFLCMTPFLVSGQWSEPTMKVKISNQAEDKTVDIETVAGKNKLLTITDISTINVPNGIDPICDTFIPITAAGLAGDQVGVFVATTTIDTTIPDSNIPGFNLVYTLTASDAGNERQLAVSLADFLETATSFNDSLLEAKVVTGDKRAIVHISCEEFSLTGEFHERATFLVTSTGTTSIILDTKNEKIISRAKETALARDPSNPHKLGILGISGSVDIRPEGVSGLFIETLKDASLSAEQTVDGSVVPREFNLLADPTRQTIVDTIRCWCTDNGIKFGQYCGINVPLVNGLMFTIRSKGVTNDIVNIKSTDDWKHIFTIANGRFDISVQAGRDDLTSSIVLTNPFLLEPQGTNPEDDFIKVAVRDDLSTIISQQCAAGGFRRDL